MGSFLKDFRDFAMKGNVIDMAVGVIIGAAFGKIVSSLVSDIIMPLIGVLTGGINFSHLSIVLSPAVTENGEVVKEANVLAYGAFIDTVLNFLIIALCIFIVIRAIQKSKERLTKPDVVEVEAAPTTEALLADIRDLLIERRDQNENGQG